MTIAYDFHDDTAPSDFLDRFDLGSGVERQTNLLLPSARFTLFALTAIFAGAALAFIT
ncbi:MAG: hypothetical protein JOZ72_19540 [Alphaproteobacteria bacterium]|nr:hypothetical protein [Alphaproteobacteria bacterium]